MMPSQQIAAITRRPLDLEDYIDIVRRHGSWILGPLFAGLVIACVVAFSLPNTYVSSAVMRISPAQISSVLVTSTVTQEMNERIAQMQQDIMSRASLSELIQRPSLNLYPNERQNRPLEDVIEQMRTRDVHIGILPVAGQGNRPASAFVISFSYKDRFKAQAVVSALITRFTESMVNVQLQEGKTTTDFMKQEVEQSRADVTRLENEITEFRIQNAGHLPEDLQYNVANLNMLQGQMGAVSEALNRISEDKLTLETNLQTLRTQRDNYQQMGTTSMAATRAQNDQLARINGEIAELEARLLQLREVYQDTYPDIRNFKSLLALKKRERDRLQAAEEMEAAKPKAAPKVVTNPMIAERLVEIQGQIDQVTTQLRIKETERLQRLKQLDDINKNVITYQSRIAASPPNQQKYAAMIREHALADAHYQELERKQAMALQSAQVGTRKAGENLEVLDNASLPESPTAPDRKLLMGIGVGLGLLAGIFLAGIKEVKDTTLKNLKDVRAYTNLPILSSIPLLENDLLVRRKRRLTYLGWATAVILGIAVMSGSMYYHYFLMTSS